MALTRSERGPGIARRLGWAVCPLLLAAGACSSSGHHPAPSAPSPSLAGWYAGGGQSLITSLTADLTTLNSATLSGPQVDAAETTMEADLSRARSYRVPADEQARIAWNRALDEVATFAAARPSLLALAGTPGFTAKAAAGPAAIADLATVDEAERGV